MMSIDKKIINLGYYLFIPLTYLGAGVVFRYFKLSYFNHPELFLIFNLFLLLLFIEVCVNWKIQPKNLSGRLQEWNYVTALNVIFLFIICGAFILMDYLSLSVEFRGGQVNNVVVSYLSTSPFENLVRLFIIFLFLINLWLTLPYANIRKKIILNEYFVLKGLLCAFLILAVACKNFFLLLLLMEVISLLLIGLICFSRSVASFEVALKFFTVSAIFTCIGLFGTVIIYATFQTLDYRDFQSLSVLISLPGQELLTAGQLHFLNFGIILFIFTLIFKLGAFPFYIYVGDYAAEAIYPLVFFFLITLKVGVFFILTSIYLSAVHAASILSIFFLFSGVSSVIVGAKSAVGETELKKFLGFTSINQFGFALVSLGVHNYMGLTAAYIFVFSYSLAMILFLFVPMQSFNAKNAEAFLYLNHIAYYGNFDARIWRAFDYLTLGEFGQKNTIKWWATYEFRFLILLFSFIGIPPFPGFSTKFLIFFVLICYKHYLITVILLLLSLISAYYYLNLIYKLFNKNVTNDIIINEMYFKFFDYNLLRWFHAGLFFIFLALGVLFLDISFFYWLCEFVRNSI